MRRLVVVLPLLALVVSCGQPAAPTEPFGVPPAAPTSSAPVTLSAEEIEMFGPRIELPGGLLQKQLGKVAQYGGPDDTDYDTWTVRVVLDSIEVDPDCGFDVDTGRPHSLILSLRVETNEGFEPLTDPIPQYFSWSTIGPDGVSEAAPSSSYGCRQGKDFPTELRPSAKYRGEIRVDTANPAGQLVLLDYFVWDYPTP